MSSKQGASLNLYQKLAKIQQAVDVIQKDKQGYGYKYVSESLLLPKITAEMRKYGVQLIPGIIPGTTRVNPYSYTKKKTSKSGTVEETVNEFFVQADTQYTWVNNDNVSEMIVVPWTMTGNQSDSSMAFGSALTYSERYFLLKYFHCATTEDDPDAIRTRQAGDMAKNELAELHTAIGEFIDDLLSDLPDERDNVRLMVSKHVAEVGADGKPVITGDFHRITKKARAAALLKELQSTYNK